MSHSLSRMKNYRGRLQSKKEKTPLAFDEKAKKRVYNSLSVVLADCYVLYMKSQNFHWNVTGARFLALHDLFEQQYKDIGRAIDEIAERIRYLGFRAPASFIEFQSMTQLDEVAQVENEEQMIRILINDHKVIVRTIRDMLPAIQEVQDDGTDELLSARLAWHEKNIWILRSLLENSEEGSSKNPIFGSEDEMTHLYHPQL